ncbi:MAG: restriction endonuclease subunit S [Bacteroidales bacterium]|nr:restriction endonuclease subunit S [Bacteroidales bacterium]
MGEIMDISRGASPRPIQAFLTDSELGVPWIKIGDISPDSKFVTSTEQKITKEGALKSRLLHKGDFILSNSMSFGRPYILSIEGCIHDGWVSLQNYQDSYISDFLYHLLKSDFVQSFWRKNAGQGGAVSNLNADIIRKTPIPIPPIELQEKIVAILDRFETLVNDLTKGLPAEIAAVKEQYEYYRNKLLTFKQIA